MPTVVFKALSIVSETESAAWTNSFQPGNNLLLGTNSTGKSRVIKFLMWALGAEPPRRTANGFDKDAIALLELTADDEVLIFLRRGDANAVFNAEGSLLFASASGSAWAEYFADLFDYPLKLQRHDAGDIGFAGPSYALLPFYLDQDEGWESKWASFSDLGQFAAWTGPVFDYFTGRRSSDYAAARIERMTIMAQRRDAQARQRLHTQTRTAVRSMLPEEPVSLDEGLFAAELKRLVDSVTELAKQQEWAKSRLAEVARQREQKRADLRLARRAEKDLMEDLAYLSDFQDESEIECPTCGHLHGVSLMARLDLAQTTDETHQLCLTLGRELEALVRQEAELADRLAALSKRHQDIELQLAEQRGDRTLEDVIAAKSQDVVMLAFDKTGEAVRAELGKLEAQLVDVDTRLLQLSNKDNEKAVEQFYKDSVKALASKLDVTQKELGGRLAIGRKPPEASGSPFPRTALANNLALVATHHEFGNGPTFPLVVDTPQQKGQDDPNLAKALNEVFAAVGVRQRILAVEKLPSGWRPAADVKVIDFIHDRALLQRPAFEEVAVKVRPFLRAMDEALRPIDRSDRVESLFVEDEPDTE